MLQHAELVEDAAQGPHIGLPVVGLASADLGAHVIRRPYDGHSSLRRTLQYPGDAKVAELDLGTATCEEDVGGLQVPVQHLLGVDVLKREAELHEPSHDLIFGEVVARLCLLLDGLSQVARITILHDDHQGVRTLDEEAVPVCDDVGVAKGLEEEDLLVRQVLVMLVQCSQRDALGDEGLVCGGLPDQLRAGVLPPPNVLDPLQPKTREVDLSCRLSHLTERASALLALPVEMLRPRALHQKNLA
mmetsp:Transcript_87141/g.255046  ORF Transcript_87141/g.255046 Transcript_87141/m.255046 type:complete len:245 (+) Transcript_87141:318-1052(+)